MKLKWLAFALLYFFSTIAAAPGVRADMGRIHAHEAKISEDAQKAIILHNYEEEVLILGTDLKAEKNMGVVRFIPFPSEPEVGLAPEKAFEEAARLIKEHHIKYYMASKGGGATAQAVEIRFNQRLGAHDLTTIKVNDVSKFRNWVNDFFKKKGQPTKDSYPDIESVVEDYVRRGIVYFVVDYVEVTPELRMIEPLAYRFKTKELYYPLKTSNTFGGKGEIALIMFLPRTLCSPIGWHPGGCPGKLQGANSGSRLVKKDELTGIYPRAADFFKDLKIYLQIFEYYGEYRFDFDLFADIAKGMDQETGAETLDDGIINLEEILKDLEQKKP